MESAKEMDFVNISKAFKYSLANDFFSSSERIKDSYFNRFDVITNAMVKDVYTNTMQWMEDDDMVKLFLLYIPEYGILGKESHSEIKMDHVGIVLGYETILKLGRLAIHKSNENDVVATLEANTSEQNMLTTSELGYDEHHHDVIIMLMMLVATPLYLRPKTRIKRCHFEKMDFSLCDPPRISLSLAPPSSSPFQSSSLSLSLYSGWQHKSMARVLLLLIRLFLKWALGFQKGEGSQKYIIPSFMQDEDVIYRSSVMEVVYKEDNEYVNKEKDVNKEKNKLVNKEENEVVSKEDNEDDVNKMEAKEGDNRLEERPSNDERD
ncbi:hypothetical protein FNV43_RR21645 [Rhamnella rubrinervis]|uniref:Uncharacterized protein n=1 Tax=Rhamnella rubrinervis TaxID=2594499 RepID=A0A8K0GUD8_9ROSA|nr:hypothetical protein FNV43_RR21645 [Rhamnella rubrinervis]